MTSRIAGRRWIVEHALIVRDGVCSVQRLAVLTSAGNAPGMTAAIRAVVRSALACGFEVVGVRDGYQGLALGEFRPTARRDVGGIIQMGGTRLGTTRYGPLKTPQGREPALMALRAHEIAALVVIGGNGSQSGAAAQPASLTECSGHCWESQRWMRRSSVVMECSSACATASRPARRWPKWPAG